MFSTFGVGGFGVAASTSSGGSGIGMALGIGVGCEQEVEKMSPVKIPSKRNFFMIIFGHWPEAFGNSEESPPGQRWQFRRL